MTNWTSPWNEFNEQGKRIYTTTGISLDKLLECYFAAFSVSCFHIVCVSALVSTYYSIPLFYATVPRWQTPLKHTRTEGRIWTHRTQFGFISLGVVFATRNHKWGNYNHGHPCLIQHTDASHAQVAARLSANLTGTSAYYMTSGGTGDTASGDGSLSWLLKCHEINQQTGADKTFRGSKKKRVETQDLERTGK